MVWFRVTAPGRATCIASNKKTLESTIKFGTLFSFKILSYYGNWFKKESTVL